MVRAAAGGDETVSRDALATLCRLYWFPLYAHIRRRWHDTEEARDLTQEFFARLLEKDWLQAANPDRGRFRTFLLTSLDHFLANEWDRRRAVKRGGAVISLSLDFAEAERRLALDPAGGTTPEREFERRWALALLDQVLNRLREEYVSPEKAHLLETLQPYLARGSGNAPYRELALQLGMTEGAVKVAVHRMRQRFGFLLRQEIAQTLATIEDVDDEIRSLFAALS